MSCVRDQAEIIELIGDRDHVADRLRALTIVRMPLHDLPSSQRPHFSMSGVREQLRESRAEEKNSQHRAIELAFEPAPCCSAYAICDRFGSTMPHTQHAAGCNLGCRTSNVDRGARAFPSNQLLAVLPLARLQLTAIGLLLPEMLSTSAIVKTVVSDDKIVTYQ